MNLEQLQYFVTIADTKSFSETAVVQNISQSSVSKQIRALENEFGFVLFDRDNRNVELSQSGELLYPAAKRMITDMEELLHTAGEIRSEQDWNIEIVGLPTMSRYNFVQALENCQRDYPQMKFCLREREEPELAAALAQGACDIAVTRKEMLPKRGFRTYLMEEHRLGIYVDADHRFGNRENVDIWELAEEPVLLMPEYTCIYQLCMELFEKAGIAPFNPRCVRPETMFRSIRNKNCAAMLIDHSNDTFQSSHIHFAPIIPETVSQIVVAVSEKGQKKPAVRKLLPYIT